MYLTAGLHRSVQKHPDKVAVITGERRTTFAELHTQIAKTASALTQLGLQSGDRVAVLAQNSDQMMVVILACWWAGLVATPLNTRWSPSEIAYALNDSGAAALVVDEALLHSAQKIAEQLPALKHRLYMPYGACPVGYAPLQALASVASGAEDLRVEPDTLAAIVYTGGTTGFPKGVMLSHANIWASLVSRMAEVPNPAHFVTLLISPMFHVAGLGRMIGQTIVGGTCVTQPNFVPKEVLRVMQQEHVTDLVVVPSMLHMLLDTEGFNPQNLPALERILWGAAPITLPLLQCAIAAFPAVNFVHVYGMTETSASVSTLAISREPAFLQSPRIKSAGQAGLNAEIRIADTMGREVQNGTHGEIWVRGSSVMQGYWNKPTETAQALVDGWLRTGDGGYVDADGYLYVIDRIKDMVISGGENIYPAEVEAVLCAHPSVANAAVIGVPHDKWGEAVHAVVVLRAGASVEAETLDAFCRSKLGGFKCPKTYAFVDALPLTPAGKVQKTKLRSQTNKPS